MKKQYKHNLLIKAYCGLHISPHSYSTLYPKQSQFMPEPFQFLICYAIIKL